jgi:hypothetical protein
MVIWNTLRIFGIFCDYSVHIVLIWYIFSCFGIVHQEKSGNPGGQEKIKGAEEEERNKGSLTSKKSFRAFGYFFRHFQSDGEDRISVMPVHRGIRTHSR